MSSYDFRGKFNELTSSYLGYLPNSQQHNENSIETSSEQKKPLGRHTLQFLSMFVSQFRSIIFKKLLS